ncbi:MAG: hypothetical protein EOO54_26085 [Haliea sp.]|nr:MAG: hypothetical protein EOO54_26085 [Haliea sp.]
MEAQQQEETLPSPRSDLVSGGVWVVIGAAIAIGSWNMDRLEKQGVQAFTAPGLVPGVLGVMILLAALAIVVRSVRRGALNVVGSAPAGPGIAGVAAALVLCIGYAGVLIGHGLPFWAASSLYLFLHIFVLQWPERRAAAQVPRGLAVAAVIGLAGGVSIALLFEYAFLVRLP